jgi:ATP-dependent helicase YprA (DUF1998 family)
MTYGGSYFTTYDCQGEDRFAPCAKEGSERDAIIDGFREGREKILITTNVTSRGIDVLQVNMVVDYDLPLMNDREQQAGVEVRDQISRRIYIASVRTGPQ